MHECQILLISNTWCRMRIWKQGIVNAAKKTIRLPKSFTRSILKGTGSVGSVERKTLEKTTREIRPTTLRVGGPGGNAIERGWPTTRRHTANDGRKKSKSIRTLGIKGTPSNVGLERKLGWSFWRDSSTKSRALFVEIRSQRCTIPTIKGPSTLFGFAVSITPGCTAKLDIKKSSGLRMVISDRRAATEPLILLI